MATHRIPIVIVKQDSTVGFDSASNQISAAAAPSLGGQMVFILADGGSDEGFQVKWSVPKNYVGSPVLVIRGVLDGAPGAGDDLGFGVRPRAVADNESADGTYDAEQTAQVTDLSSWGNEDEYEETITLTGTYAADDSVYAYVYLDASGTTYTGNFLMTPGCCLFFQYADA